jgi:hypothetical protein
MRLPGIESTSAVVAALSCRAAKSGVIVWGLVIVVSACAHQDHSIRSSPETAPVVAVDSLIVGLDDVRHIAGVDDRTLNVTGDDRQPRPPIQNRRVHVEFSIHRLPLATIGHSFARLPTPDRPIRTCRAYRYRHRCRPTTRARSRPLPRNR